jgi:hypothetical protein
MLVEVGQQARHLVYEASSHTPQQNTSCFTRNKTAAEQGHGRVGVSEERTAQGGGAGGSGEGEERVGEGEEYSANMTVYFPFPPEFGEEGLPVPAQALLVPREARRIWYQGLVPL